MKWEHKTVVIETKGLIGRGVIDASQIDEKIRQWGDLGYELVSVIPVSDGNVGTSRIALFFKRPKEEA